MFHIFLVGGREVREGWMEVKGAEAETGTQEGGLGGHAVTVQEVSSTRVSGCEKCKASK